MHEDDLAAVLAEPVAQRLYFTVELTRLAYTAPDGGPRILPIGYLWTGSAFVLRTPPDADEVTALRRDPRVALTIDAGGYPPNVLLVRGTAAIDVDGGDRLAARMARIGITPTWAKLLDFATGVPSATEKPVQERYRS